jgi:phosphoribosylformylglycinamidine (FGAM) synthase-like amidotransferase family enzyme
MPLLGICNGFQVLAEAHLIPGALTRNHELHFLCRDQKLTIENTTLHGHLHIRKVKKFDPAKKWGRRIYVR